MTSAIKTAGPLPGRIGSFSGDAATFNLVQWAPAIDAMISRAITPNTSLHVGLQGEIYLPIPLPAYGLYAGVSHYQRLGPIALGPALTVRGASDFGIALVGTSGSLVGSEVSCSIVIPGDDARLAFVPFYGAHLVYPRGASSEVGYYAGGAFAYQVALGHSASYFELSAGFGRVFEPNVASWNAPIVGFRWVR